MDIFESPHVSAALYFTDQGHYLFKSKKQNDRGNGEVVSKNLRDEEVRAAFTRKGMDSGWLAPGVVRAGSNAKGPWYVYLVGPRAQAMNILGTGRMVIPLPATLMIAAAGDLRLFALDLIGPNPQNLPTAKLYHAPFPNVHSDGRICWGKNAAPKVDASLARAAWQLFFESPFNGDLAGDKSKKYPADVRLMLGELDMKEHYPLKDLKSTNIAQSVEKSLMNIIGGIGD